MKNEFWINLPSKDLEKARRFFTAMGFELNAPPSSSPMVSLFVGGKKIIVNLFTEAYFREAIGGQGVTDTHQSNEVLLSIGADSPAEVDDWAKRAQAAGATVFGKPGYKDGWLYGCGFADPDGHRWNILHMDMSKMPK